MTGESVFDLEERPVGEDSPAGLGWLMPSLSLLLAGVAAAQFIYFVPKTLYVVQRLSGRPPGYLNILAEIPPWLSAIMAGQTHQIQL
ncbi:hypothetical protein [Zavarzinella formosa]|uniref:hypothetical protein n=1 Tax=Zavarzinella formosa TaxID=360055 RepID=UPI00031AB0C2|nr:hypothetical protein [Zavarzinella formosa]